MKQFLQEWRDTTGQKLKFIHPIVDELLLQDIPNLDAAIKERYILRESYERFSVDYMFHWSIVSYLEDVNSRYKAMYSKQQ